MIVHVVYLTLLAVLGALVIWLGHGKLKALRAARVFADTCRQMTYAIEFDLDHAATKAVPTGPPSAKFELTQVMSEVWRFHHERLAQLHNTTSGLMEAALADLEVTVR